CSRPLRAGSATSMQPPCWLLCCLSSSTHSFPSKAVQPQLLSRLVDKGVTLGSHPSLKNKRPPSRFLYLGVPMSTIDLNKDTFQTAIQDSKPMIVDFWAPWCGPCRNFAPVFEEAATQHEDIVFAKVNTEEEQELATGLKIRS